MTSSDRTSPAAALSWLVFSGAADWRDQLPRMTREQFDEFVALAQTNHVVVRAMTRFRQIATEANDDTRRQWADEALAQERMRIEHAVPFLKEICGVLSKAGCDVTVIKSLDHWPDLGSDLDLYTNADPEDVIRAMTQGCDAAVAERSWGDRLAHRWNFIVPGLPELVEIHVGRLGQTGELVGFAASIPARSRTFRVWNYAFQVPAAEDRLVICTLQRMYRHFYARLCDIADTVQLLEEGPVDFPRLLASAEANGIAEGVATFLVIVSDLAKRWRGRGVILPDSIRNRARFGGEQIAFARDFLRIPILPHSLRLYASEWTNLISRGQLRSTARLSLLPWLATAAALDQKLTGSDKGIW